MQERVLMHFFHPKSKSKLQSKETKDILPYPNFSLTSFYQ